jgi:hypothetical protein
VGKETDTAQYASKMPYISSLYNVQNLLKICEYSISCTHILVQRFQVTLGPYLNVTAFQSLYRGFQILGYAHSMWCHSLTIANRFPGQVIKQVRGGKEVVRAVCNQLPLLSSSYLSLCHGLLSGVVSFAVCPYPGTNPSHV